VLGGGAFHRSPKVFELKFMGVARSRAVRRVKGAEKAPAIM